MCMYCIESYVCIFMSNGYLLIKNVNFELMIKMEKFLCNISAGRFNRNGYVCCEIIYMQLVRS